MIANNDARSCILKYKELLIIRLFNTVDANEDPSSIERCCRHKKYRRTKSEFQLFVLSYLKLFTKNHFVENI